MLGYVQQIAAAIKGREKPSKVPASLFWQNENFGIDGLNFDLLIDETNGVEYEVSEHVLENGEAIADHVRPHLRKVTITGLFTNHGMWSNSADWVDENGKYKKGADKIKLNGEPMEENTALESYQRLQAIAAKRQPVKLTAALEIYENMLITRLNTTRGPDDGESIRFTCDLQEIKNVKLLNAQYVDTTWQPKDQSKEARARVMAKYKMGGNVTAQDVKAADMAADFGSANQGSMAQ